MYFKIPCFNYKKNENKGILPKSCLPRNILPFDRHTNYSTEADILIVWIEDPLRGRFFILGTVKLTPPPIINKIIN